MTSLFVHESGIENGGGATNSGCSCCYHFRYRHHRHGDDAFSASCLAIETGDDGHQDQDQDCGCCCWHFVSRAAIDSTLVSDGNSGFYDCDCGFAVLSSTQVTTIALDWSSDC